MYEETTIAAIATSPGEGGIGILVILIVKYILLMLMDRNTIFVIMLIMMKMYLHGKQLTLYIQD